MKATCGLRPSDSITERSDDETISLSNRSEVSGETTISVSIPIAGRSSDLATAAQTQRSLCEIDPTNPSGQIGDRSLATPTSSAISQRFNSTAAHDRPAANSRWRFVALQENSRASSSCSRRRKIVCVPSGNTELAQREAVFTRSSAQVFEVVTKVWQD